LLDVGTREERENRMEEASHRLCDRPAGLVIHWGSSMCTPPFPPRGGGFEAEIAIEPKSSLRPAAATVDAESAGAALQVRAARDWI
jgi:hypothetical protein